MLGKWMRWGLAVIVALVMAYAWIDGGEEDLHDITMPVAIPGGAR